ncbi:MULTISPECIES: LppP/LprE family lipoprotein [unclassified Corynebacterium]|uniref:LppP/LprE family lipoprotein n=1 Tax=unclassified Corynebacterium TaxID=2624378 RepID=UPI0030AAA411
MTFAIAGCGDDSVDNVDAAGGMTVVENPPAPNGGSNGSGGSDGDNSDGGNSDSDSRNTNDGPRPTGRASSGDANTTVTETKTATEKKKKDSGSSGSCSVDTQADEIYKGLDKANKEYPNNAGGWTYTGDSNYDTCSPLTYAYVEQTLQGSGQFGTLLLMFHEGKYLGVDSVYPQQAMSVSETDNGFVVQYKDWEAAREAGASNAEAAAYTSTVTYYWDGKKVAHSGRIPNTGLDPLG